MEKVDTLKDFTKIVVETDEKNPATIAQLQMVKRLLRMDTGFTPKYD